MTSTASNWDALAGRLDQVKKPVQAFKLCEDPDIRDRFREATYEADKTAERVKDLAADADPDTRAFVQKQAADAAAELAEAKQAYDAHVIVLRFTALERHDLEDLQKIHPATEEDEANGADFAFDTFAPALISAASLDGMPVDAARRYMHTWSAADSRGLWNAAWSIQHQQRTDLGKG